MFEMSRGAKGNSLLPMYFGNTLEPTLANDANRAYFSDQALLGTPEQQYAKYLALVNGMQPAVDASNRTVGDIFNGNLTQQQLGFQQPVNQARTNLALGQKQSVYDSLAQRLDAITAENAKSGFTGSGSFNRNRMLVTVIGGNQQAAGIMGQANLQNATDIAGIQNSGQQRMLQNLGLPFTQAQQNIALSGLPMNSVFANQQNAMQPYNFFRTNPQAFQYAPFPTVQPNFGMANLAQNANISTNANLNQLLGHMNNQNTANQMNQMPSGSGTASGFGSGNTFASGVDTSFGGTGGWGNAPSGGEFSGAGFGSGDISGDVPVGN